MIPIKKSAVYMTLQTHCNLAHRVLENWGNHYLALVEIYTVPLLSFNRMERGRQYQILASVRVTCKSLFFTYLGLIYRLLGKVKLCRQVRRAKNSRHLLCSKCRLFLHSMNTWKYISIILSVDETEVCLYNSRNPCH